MILIFFNEFRSKADSTGWLIIQLILHLSCDNKQMEADLTPNVLLRVDSNPRPLVSLCSRLLVCTSLGYVTKLPWLVKTK